MYRFELDPPRITRGDTFRYKHHVLYVRHSFSVDVLPGSPIKEWWYIDVDSRMPDVSNDLMSFPGIIFATEPCAMKLLGIDKSDHDMTYTVRRWLDKRNAVMCLSGALCRDLVRHIVGLL